MNDEPKPERFSSLHSPNDPPPPHPDMPQPKVENPDPKPEPPDPVTGRPASEKPPEPSQESHEAKEARQEHEKYEKTHEGRSEQQAHPPGDSDDPDEVEGEIDEAEDDGDIETSKHRGKTAAHKRKKR